MQSIRFPQANVALGKNQEQYQTLYAFVDPSSSEVPATFCYELTDEEIAQIVKTRKFWFTQLTFGSAFQPVRIVIDQPSLEPCIMQSAFQFENGRRIIVYSSYSTGIKSFECNEDWEPYNEPFADCPMEWAGSTMTEYHKRIRAQHVPEAFVPEHSSPIAE